MSGISCWVSLKENRTHSRSATEQRETLMVQVSCLDTVTKQLDSTHPHMDSWTFHQLIRLNSNILLHRLSGLQVQPTLMLWIKDCLMDRPQHVFLKGFKSSSTALKAGLPQGCVLSPILFSAYKNITSSREGLKLVKYADDMALLAHITNTAHTPWSKHLLRAH